MANTHEAAKAKRPRKLWLKTGLLMSIEEKPIVHVEATYMHSYLTVKESRRLRDWLTRYLDWLEAKKEK